MLLKKYALLGTALATLGLPVLASADLLTINHTNEASSVRLSTGRCPALYTKPHDQLPTPTVIVQGLCGSHCTAQVFASSDCTGKQTGLVTIDTTHNINVTVNQSMNGYLITSSGSTVTIDYAHK